MIALALLDPRQLRLGQQRQRRQSDRSENGFDWCVPGIPGPDETLIMRDEPRASRANRVRSGQGIDGWRGREAAGGEGCADGVNRLAQIERSGQQRRADVRLGGERGGERFVVGQSQQARVAGPGGDVRGRSEMFLEARAGAPRGGVREVEREFGADQREAAGTGGGVVRGLGHATISMRFRLRVNGVARL